MVLLNLKNGDNREEGGYLIQDEDGGDPAGGLKAVLSFLCFWSFYYFFFETSLSKVASFFVFRFGKFLAFSSQRKQKYQNAKSPSMFLASLRHTE